METERLRTKPRFAPFRKAGEGWNTGTMEYLGYGEVVKWVTCREPQGRAIDKIHIDKGVQDVYK